MIEKLVVNQKFKYKHKIYVLVPVNLLAFRKKETYDKAEYNIKRFLNDYQDGVYVFKTGQGRKKRGRRSVLKITASWAAWLNKNNVVMLKDYRYVYFGNRDFLATKKLLGIKIKTYGIEP